MILLMHVLQSIENIFYKDTISLLKNKDKRPHKIEYLTGESLNHFIPLTFVPAE